MEYYGLTTGRDAMKLARPERGEEFRPERREGPGMKEAGAALGRSALHPTVMDGTASPSGPVCLPFLRPRWSASFVDHSLMFFKAARKPNEASYTCRTPSMDFSSAQSNAKSWSSPAPTSRNSVTSCSVRQTATPNPVVELLQDELMSAFPQIVSNSSVFPDPPSPTTSTRGIAGQNLV